MAMDFERYKKLNDEKPLQGPLEGAQVVHRYTNQGCGDGYTLYLKLEQGRIAQARYTTSGCGFGVAALETLCALAQGKTLAEARTLRPEDIEAAFEFPPKRKAYPQTAWEAFQGALDAAEPAASSQ